MKKYYAILLLIFTSVSAMATHNRAGEITYCVDPNNPLKYYFTVTTYTDPASTSADRCEIEILYGDNSGPDGNGRDTIYRVNNQPGLSCMCSNCGEILITGVKKNIYTSVHVFSGPGTFNISVNDPNRNAGIINIPDSDNKSFFIQNILTINNFAGTNCSPDLTFPPIDDGCVGVLYEHNPGAVDPEGDSLAYSIIPCMDGVDHAIEGYEYPHLAQSPSPQTLTIDATGTVQWDSPQLQGEFNLCILIEEYRNGVLVGNVTRDMQITIQSCTNNPPTINFETPICVVAGDTINEVIEVDDPDFDFVKLTSQGEPYTMANPAIYDSIMNLVPYSSHFYWETTCDNVRRNPYLVYFRAEDDGNGTNVRLVTYETMSVQVVAPAPENAQASPQGYDISLSWDASICTNATCYKIYRKLDSLGWRPDTCEVGVPSSTGYTLLAEVSGLNNTSYTDTQLTHGQKYCYMIVACFADGAESYASEEVCAELTRDIPVITHVSVNSTDVTTGSDTIIWSYPVDLDTNSFLGPYYYEIFRNGNSIGTTNTSMSLLSVDTLFVDKNLNTEIQHQYYVELFYTGGSVGSTQTASSVFLEMDAADTTDNRLNLFWNVSVPWVNYDYMVLKYNELSSSFDTIDTVSTTFYKDTGLINGVQYCYKIISIGSYSSPGFVDPLYNHSQELCGIPEDNIAPCPPPSPYIDASCEDMRNIFTWENPNESCADDVIGYNLYYAPLLGQTLQLTDSIRDAETTSYQQNLEGSIAGCYAVTAIDTFYNESPFSEILCVDNCPVYTLPGVFSPNGDGINEFFRPYPYKFIESIDLKIYNRWGALVFDEQDPEILWDGVNEFTGNPCNSGVYYYICEVRENRLTGIETIILKGYVHLIRDGNAGSNN